MRVCRHPALLGQAFQAISECRLWLAEIATETEKHSHHL
jgi:hypothetical protein